MKDPQSKNKRLVIFAHNTIVGGAEQFAVLTAQGFIHDYGWEVTLICADLPLLDNWVAEFEAVGGKVVRASYNRPWHWLTHDVPRCWQIIQQADVVHINIAGQVSKIYPVGIIMGWLARRPVVTSERIVNNLASLPGLNKWTRGLWRTAISLVHKLATRVVVVSEDDRRSMIKQFKVSPDKIVVIPVGVNYDLYKPEYRSQAPQIRARYGLNQDHKLLCTVGRLDPVKGIHILIEAASLILARRPEARFILVGTGSQEEAIRRKLHETGLESVFILTGQLSSPEVARLLPACDLMVQASLYESFSRAGCEAVASELPLVTTDVGAMRELIEDGVSGRLVPVGNAAALAEAVCERLDDPEGSRHMARLARQHLPKRFSLPENLRATHELYGVLSFEF